LGQSHLIKRCQSGDKQAFEELYQLYCQQALKTAYLISGRRGIAEDIVQEAFIQCFKEIKQLKEPDAFYSWFYKIIIRCGWRMNAKYQNKMIVTGFGENYDTHPDQNSNMDDLVEAKEIYDLIQQALLKLKPPVRAVVVLYYYNDLKIAEISSILGCFQGTIKSRLYTAKKFLEKELKQYFSNEDALPDTNQRKESITNG
jgi:RNA polymerase sigma-70 factor (ECF subfamily)